MITPLVVLTLFLWGIPLFIFYKTDLFSKKKSLLLSVIFWLWGGIPVFLIILGCLLLWENWSTQDVSSFYSYIILRVAGATLGIFLLTGAILFLDFITIGNWLEKIEDAPYGPTIVVSSLIITLGIILIWI